MSIEVDEKLQRLNIVKELRSRMLDVISYCTNGDKPSQEMYLWATYRNTWIVGKETEKYREKLIRDIDSDDLDMLWDDLIKCSCAVDALTETVIRESDRRKHERSCNCTVCNRTTE